MLSDDVSVTDFVTDGDVSVTDFALQRDSSDTLDGLSIPRNFLGSEVVLSGGGLLLGDGLFSTCEKSVSSVASLSFSRVKSGISAS